MFVLQRIVFPHFNFNAPEEMYVRLGDQVRAYAKENRIVCASYAKVSFDTYFNGFSVGRWKQICPSVRDLSCFLKGRGRFLVRFGLHRIGHSHKWLDEQEVDLRDGGSQYISLDCWPSLEDGLLFFQLQSIDDGEIWDGGWFTNTEPVNPVKLGIVITHFNRKKFVVPAIHRISETLLADPYFQGKIDLIVVDNSQNITQEEAQQAIIVPNENLGGSGGFMRGLLHLKRQSDYTHCLFMDDDASCEIESIRRTFMLAQYAEVERFSVAGSLLRELEPHRMLEKGAMFDGFVRQFKSGFDLRNVNDLLWSDFPDHNPQYGAWFFFCFKIGDVRHMAFPYFVRGDDIAFGLMNQFTILTMNGIGCWGDDFALKSGPIPAYLDTRSHILNAMVLVDSNYKAIKRVADHFVIKQLYSFNYASAKACRMAVQHIMKGTDFFVHNMNTSEIRGEIGSFSSSEKLMSLQRNQWPLAHENINESKFRVFVRKLTLNGFLVPKIFKNKKILFQHKGFMADLKAIFLYSKVLYEYEPAAIGYYAEEDKWLCAKEYWIYLKTMLKFRLMFNKLKREYKEQFPRVANEQFWLDLYEEGVDLN